MDFFLENATPIIGIIVLSFLLLLVFKGILVGIRREIRSRGEDERLREPQFAAVEEIFGIKLHSSVKALYQKTDLIIRGEFYLAPPNTKPEEWWYIYGFIPFTVIDLKDWIGISDIPGLPFAFGGEDKGTYFFPWEPLWKGEPPPVLIDDLAVSKKSVVVANSVEEFMQMQPREWDVA